MNPTLKEKKQKYVEDFMSEIYDISTAAIPVLRYCVSSTPRSGSTFLCRSLKATGMAGVPDEYLNPLHMTAWMKHTGAESMDFGRYIANLEASRTSASGYFGMKIHWRHLEKGFGKALYSTVSNPLLARFNKFIVISRRDKLAQAISDCAARTTGAFNAIDEPYADSLQSADFDEVKITKGLCQILEEERNWLNYLTRNHCDFIEIAYEDLVAHYQPTMEYVLNFLRLGTSSIPEIPNTQMSGKHYAEMRAHWIGKIGL